MIDEIEKELQRHKGERWFNFETERIAAIVEYVRANESARNAIFVDHKIPDDGQLDRLEAARRALGL